MLLSVAIKAIQQYFCAMESQAGQQQLFRHLITTIKTGTLENVEDILRAHGDLINRQDEQTRQPPLYFASLIEGDDLSSQMIRLLIRNGANANHKDSNEQTVLFYICRQGKEKCAQILLSHGLDLDTQDIYGQTPLFYAASENRLGIMQLYGTRERVRQIDSLANQNLLYYAARRGHLQMCKLIIEKGADICHLDKTNKTAVEYARKAKFLQVADYLNGELKKEKQAQKALAPPEQISNKKSRKDDLVKEAKQTYRLVYYNDKGQATQLTLQDVQKLTQASPELAQYLANPQSIPAQALTEVDNDTWQKIALKVLNQCVKVKGAFYFLEAVDPVKLNIMDYFDIVKQPMDLGTIRKKLQYNCYQSAVSFARDMNLIWQNSYAYNGETHMVSQCANQLQTSFKQYCSSNGLSRYLEQA